MLAGSAVTPGDTVFQRFSALEAGESHFYGMRVMLRHISRNRSSLVERLFKGGLLCALMTSASSWALEDQPTVVSEIGLRGVVGAKAPSGLQSRDFELLDGKWTDWGNSTLELIEKLYSEEPLDVPAQRDLLAQLKSRADVMKTALMDRNYSQLHGPISDLHGRLVRRVEFASAVLDVLEADPGIARQARTDSAYSTLKQDLAAAKSDLSQFQGGDLWLPYLEWDALRSAAETNDVSPSTAELLNRISVKLTPNPEWTDAQKEFLQRPFLSRLNSTLVNTSQALMSPMPGEVAKTKLRETAAHFLSALDEYETTGSNIAATNARVALTELKHSASDGGAKLSELMRAHYYNYNLRVLASEGLLQRLMNDSRSESSWINQCLMGARINGSQCTTSSINVDVRPSGDRAQIDLLVNGNVRSRTTGTTEEATVFSNGYHSFQAHKGIFFDGHTFSTTATNVSASANNQIYDAQTHLSGIPLLGRIADGIAMDIAQEQVGQANSYTASQLRQEVGSRLDNEARSKFDKASLELESRVWGPLREQGLYPDTMSWSSSDINVQLQSRVMDLDELGASSAPPTASYPSDGVLIQVHESLMSNAADRFDFAGKTMKESEVRKVLEERLTKLVGKEVDIPEPVVPEGEQPVDNTLTFDSVDPIRFQVEGGQVKFLMRAGLKPQNGDEIPVQIISVPLSFKVEGNQILMERGNVGVKPIAPVDNPTEQITRARIMIQNIQRAIPNKTLKGEIVREIEGRSIRMTVTGIQARDGWLSIEAH